LEVDEREVPLKTPPPESGPQAAIPLPPGLEQPLTPSEYDSGIHRAEQLDIELPYAGPTHAQLGQTIELEEARGPALELDMRGKSSVPSPPVDELEAPLPARVHTEPPVSVKAVRVSVAPEPLVPEVSERAVPAAEAQPLRVSPPRRAFAPTTFLELLDASLGLGTD
jgi:hypothetical protein